MFSTIDTTIPCPSFDAGFVNSALGSKKPIKSRLDTVLAVHFCFRHSIAE